VGPPKLAVQQQVRRPRLELAVSEAGPLPAAAAPLGGRLVRRWGGVGGWVGVGRSPRLWLAGASSLPMSAWLLPAAQGQAAGPAVPHPHHTTHIQTLLMLWVRRVRPTPPHPHTPTPTPTHPHPPTHC
jgi:hypothetical protein